MVYRGRPSKSCRQCRKRDIKCDKQKASCGQCIRANLPCPGYHDPRTLIFNDQTQTVVRKANGKPPSLARPERPLVLCIEDRAKNLFISDYVYCKTDRLPYMEHFWDTQPPHAHLAAALQAVSIIYLATELCSPEIHQRAIKQYSLALQLTNTALQSPQSVKHNATLLTVLILSMYEKFTRRLVDGSPDEYKHLEGALALLHLSDASQFDDSIRLQLFHHVSMRTLLRCLDCGDGIPANLLSLRQSIDVTNKDSRFHDLVMEFVVLQNAVRKGDMPESEIYVEVKRLDDELVQICTRIPTWKFMDVILGRVDHKELLIHLLEATSAS